MLKSATPVPYEKYKSRMSDLATMLARSARYAAAQGWDALTNPQPTELETIPWHFNAITPDWLTKAMCTHVPGAAVTSVELGIGHVGTSGRQQLLVTYNETGRKAGLPGSLFAKGTPTFVTRLSMSTVPSMQIEAQFYRLVRPKLEIEAPFGYYSAYDLSSGRSIHLLEDLVATRGATFPTWDTPVTREMAESIVSTLAALHGRFYKSPELAKVFSPLMTWPQEYRRMSRLMDLEKYHLRGLDKAKEFIPESLYARRNETWPAIVQCTELHDELPQTLGHCDVHLGNWYITGNGRMGLLDWQCVSKGHWSRDFAYAITATLSVENRRAWDEDLLRLYLAEMKTHTGETIAFDEAWRRYRQQIFSALAFWTPTYAPPAFAPKNMQPDSLSIEMIKRFTHAIVDLDSFGALNS